MSASPNDSITIQLSYENSQKSMVLPNATNITYETVVSAVKKELNLETGFYLQFTDEEGDKLTIVDDNDIKDALELSTDSILTLFVTSKMDHTPNEELIGEQDDEKEEPNTESDQQEGNENSAPKDNSDTDDELDPNVAMALDFILNDEMNGLTAKLIGDTLNELKKEPNLLNESKVNSVITNLLQNKEYKEFIEHPFYAFILKGLPHISRFIATSFPFLQFLNEATVAMFISKFRPVIVESISSLDSFDEQSMGNLFSKFFTNGMFGMNGMNGMNGMPGMFGNMNAMNGIFGNMNNMNNNMNNNDNNNNCSEKDYKDELKQIKAMGFGYIADDKINELLRKYNGNIAKVVQDLVQ